MLAMLPLWGLLIFQPFLILTFPAGLWVFFKSTQLTSMNALEAWTFYMVVIIAVMLSRRRIRFIMFYVLLCLALAVNVTGCYHAVNETLRYLQ
jgi:hypothetical protein